MDKEKGNKKKPLKLSSSGRLQIRKNLGPAGDKSRSSGNKKTIQIVKNYFQVPECRLIEHIYVVKKNPKKYFDTACRSENGSWNVIR